MKFLIVLFVLLCVPLGYGAVLPQSMNATNGLSFGKLTVNDHIAATNTARTNIFAGKFQQGTSKAVGIGSSAFGYYGTALGQYSFLVGVSNITANSAAHVEGTRNYSGGDSSHAEGKDNEAGGIAAHVQGIGNFANADGSHASGRDVEVEFGANYTHADGVKISVGANTTNAYVWNWDWNNFLNIESNSYGSFIVNARAIDFRGPVYANGEGITNIPGSSVSGAITNYDTRSLVLTNGNTLKATNVWDKSNVKFWGAQGVNVNDQAAVNAAVAALDPTQGGVIYFPPGRYRFNYTNTINNVTFLGSGSGAADSFLAPLDPNQPLIQVGNDTALVTGFKLSQLTLLGLSPAGSPTGSSGLIFSGGAYQSVVDACEIASFTNCLVFAGGATFPCTVININDSHISGDNSLVSVNQRVIRFTYGGAYTTAIAIDGCHINGASSGFMIENDGVGVFLANSFLDFDPDHGILLKKTGATFPQFYCSGAIFDLSSAGVGVTNSFDSSTIPETTFTGTWSGGGDYSFLNGTNVALHGTGSLGNQSSVVYPFVVGTLNLADSASAITSEKYGYSDTNRIYASGGDFSFEPKVGNNSFYFGRLANTGDVRLRLRGGSKNHVVYGGATFQMLPASDAYSILFNDSSSWYYTDSGYNLIGTWNTNGLSLAKNLTVAKGVTWQGGANLTNIYTATATLDFANAVSIGCSDLTMTVTGAALGDVVDLGVPNGSVVANSSYSAWVSAADTVTVRFCALISGDPASGVFRAEVHKWK